MFDTTFAILFTINIILLLPLIIVVAKLSNNSIYYTFNELLTFNIKYFQVNTIILILSIFSIFISYHNFSILFFTIYNIIYLLFLIILLFFVMTLINNKNKYDEQYKNNNEVDLEFDKFIAKTSRDNFCKYAYDITINSINNPSDSDLFDKAVKATNKCRSLIISYDKINNKQVYSKLPFTYNNFINISVYTLVYGSILLISNSVIFWRKDRFQS